MNELTKTRIAQLQKADWFAHVGEQVDSSVIQASSWADAMASWESAEWEDAQIYMVHNLALYRSMYSTWDEFFGPLKPVLEALVDEKTKPVIDAFKLPEKFKHCVAWDISYACVASMLNIAMYDDLIRWYLNGHFPCGWRGEFPEGKLIVY